MWELICHHTYKWDGRPVDLSPYNNPAETVRKDFLADAIAPSSGALRFFFPDTSVRVLPGEAWNKIGGIKIEMTIRLMEPALNIQTLIDADNSFGIFLRNNTVFAHGVPNNDFNTEQARNGPVGYRVPFTQWIVLTFVHDGVSQMQLYVNGSPVTVVKPVPTSIPPVGARGVCIGNSHVGSQQFGGDIDEVKIWRTDPYKDTKVLISRPANDAAIDCWQRFAERLRDWLSKNPDCARLEAQFTAILDGLVRSILAKSPEARERFEEFQKEFDKLWRAGTIDGPEMTQLFSDWTHWLRQQDLAIETDPRLSRFEALDCRKRLTKEVGPLDCDSELTGLFQLIARATGLPAPEL